MALYFSFILKSDCLDALSQTEGASPTDFSPELREALVSECERILQYLPFVQTYGIGIAIVLMLAGLTLLTPASWGART